MGMEIYAVCDPLRSRKFRRTRTLLRTLPKQALFRHPGDPVHVIFIHYITNIKNCNRNHIEIP